MLILNYQRFFFFVKRGKLADLTIFHRGADEYRHLAKIVILEHSLSQFFKNAPPQISFKIGQCEVYSMTMQWYKGLKEF